MAHTVHHAKAFRSFSASFSLVLYKIYLLSPLALLLKVLSAPHARINLTTDTFKRHGPMAAEPHTLKLAPYIKREDPHLTMVDSLM